MRKVVRCACGMEIRSEDEAELIRLVQAHARDAHEMKLTDDQVRDMMEIEQ
jgi:predicted small metal-binding protein